MADKARYRRAARRAARKYGLDPHIFERQIEAESGFNPNARSPAGASGIAQIMPGTAKGWGVNLNDGRAGDDLDAAAKNMARYVKQFGSYEKALRAYNAGPGAVEKSRSYAETNNYVKKILAGGEPPKSVGAPRSRVERGKPPATASTSPQVDRQGAQRQYLAERGKPGALLNLAISLREPPEEVAVERAAKKFRKKGEGPSGRSKASIVQIGKLAQRMGLRVAEHPAFDKVDPVHTKGSYHYRNAAVDVSGDPDALARFARTVARRYGRNLEELIYRGRGGVTIKHGKRVPRSFYSGHEGHAHVAEDD
jgi:hypothetical protein